MKPTEPAQMKPVRQPQVAVIQEMAMAPMAGPAAEPAPKMALASSLSDSGFHLNWRISMEPD